MPLILLATIAFGTTLRSQHAPQLDARLKGQDEAKPLIYSFTPQFNDARQKEREALEQRIAAIDTMDISESRKYKLIRDLYRNKESRRLQKTLRDDDRFLDEPEK